MRRISKTLLAVLLILCLLSGAFAESYRAMVTKKSIKVYLSPKLSGGYGVLRRFTVVRVNATKNGVARLKYDGMTCYAAQSDLDNISTLGTPATATRDTRVYKNATLASSFTKVKAGTLVYVIETKGVCAMVQKDGRIGYMYKGHLTGYDNVSKKDEESFEQAVEEADAGDSAGTPKTLEAMIKSGSYTNEQICFAFAVKVMGYSKAAACGLLANISAESGFRPVANGDGGTSLGICQWHATRKTRLINYCRNRGYDEKELVSQLYYLQYELETYYPSVNRYMKNVGNDSDGAYDAAYYFCYNFEVPANRATQATKRAKKAQETYWPKYSGVAV